ncbi:MAG: PAS domain-containing protein [Burkholderiales bacterium]|nr:PAS domain-containing protein [Burkholderiales bacterium]
MRLTLRTKAALLTTSLVLCLVGTAGWWQYQQLSSEYVALMRKQQQALTDTAAADLDYKLGTHLAVLARAAHGVSAQTLSQAAAQQRFFAESGLRPMFDGVALIALDGSVIVNDPPNGKPLNIGDREYFQQARDGLPAVSPPLLARSVNRPAVLMAVPVKAADGRVLGVLSAGLDLHRPNVLGALSRAGAGNGDGRYYEIVTRGAAPVTVMHPDPRRLLQPVAPPEPGDRVDRAVRTDRAEQADLTTRATIASTDWELRVVLPARAARAPLEVARQALWAQLFWLGLACAALVWLATGWLMRPLEALSATMRDVRGNPDRPIRLDIAADDERGDLAREFNALMRELRDQRDQMAAVTDASPLGLFRSDADGRLSYVNEAYLAIHGLSREEAAEGWLSLVREDIRERVREDWRRQVREAAPLQLTRQLRRRDGAEVLVSLRSRPVLAEGRVVGHVGTVSDITERARAERALRTLTAVFDATTDYVVQTDFHGRLIYLNPAGRRRCGLAPDAPIEHLTIADLSPPHAVERHRLEIVPATLAHGIWVGETVMWGAERHEVPVSHMVIAHRDKHGRVEYFSAVMRDISQAQAAEKALRESEHRLRMVADNLPVLISYLDRELRFRFVNKTYREWFGVDAAGQLGMTVRQFYGEQAWNAIEPNMQAALAGRQLSYERDMVRPEWRRRVHVTLVPDRSEEGEGGEAGEVVGLFTLIADVTSFRAAEQALQESEARLRTVADALPMRVAYVDAEERYRFNNLAYERDFSKPREAFHGHTMREVMSEAAYRAAEPHIRRALAGEPTTFQSEIARGDGFAWHEAHYVPQFAADGSTVLGFHVVVTDITRQKVEERRLVELARVDTLTGVVNRAGFELRLAEAMERSRATAALMALMYLDIDGFKQINDRLGHGTGDVLLRAFAGRLVQTLRSTDTVARLGGDEFTVIMEGLPRAEVAAAVAAKIVAAMGQPFTLDEQSVRVTTSIGLAFFQGGAATAAELVKQADQMLYEAKAAGRNNFQVNLRLIEGGRT